MDYPCMVRYDEQESCVHDSWNRQPCSARIVAYLTTYKAGWYGGGCHIEDSATDELDIRNRVVGLKLKRDGETIAVNRYSLAPGEDFYRSSMLYWNPWMRSTVTIQNVGCVGICESTCPEGDQSVVLIGRYGTEVSWLKGWSLLTFAVMIFIVTQWQLRQKPDANYDTTPPETK